MPGGPRGLQNRWEAVKPSPVCSIRTLSATIRQNPVSIRLLSRYYPLARVFAQSQFAKSFQWFFGFKFLLFTPYGSKSGMSLVCS